MQRWGSIAKVGAKRKEEGGVKTQMADCKDIVYNELEKKIYTLCRACRDDNSVYLDTEGHITDIVEWAKTEKLINIIVHQEIMENDIFLKNDEWISVEDRLPNHGVPKTREECKVRYLVSLTTGNVVVATWKFHVKGRNANGYQGVWGWNQKQYRDIITAWMPLPEPYCGT